MAAQHRLQVDWSEILRHDVVLSADAPAVAPRAIAFRTSVARRTPPSTNSWNFGLGKVIPRFSFNLVTTSTKTSIPERAKSSWRPPWFDSTTPATPRS